MELEQVERVQLVEEREEQAEQEQEEQGEQEEQEEQEEEVEVVERRSREPSGEPGQDSEPGYDLVRKYTFLFQQQQKCTCSIVNLFSSQQLFPPGRRRPAGCAPAAPGAERGPLPEPGAPRQLPRHSAGRGLSPHQEHQAGQLPHGLPRPHLRPCCWPRLWPLSW